MAESKRPAHNYHVLVTNVDQSVFSQSVTSLAQHFLLDNFVAEQILKSYPIVFLTEVDRDEYKAIRTKLMEVSKSGVEFTVTSKAPVSTSHVIWLTRPHYKEAGGKLVKYVEFQWRGNAFVCPNCGETFLFQRIGNPLARFVKTQDKPAQKVAALASGEPVDASQPEASEERVDVTPVEDEESVAEEVVPVEAVPDAADDVVELTPLPSNEIPDEGLPEAVDILEEAPLEVPQVEEVPAATSEAPPAEAGVHNVFLSRITNKDKKEAAAKLIVEIKGISDGESRKLVDRMLIPVLKGVEESEAKVCLEKFKKLGVSGKISKVTTKKDT